MSEVKSDIQIAREAKMLPINDILAKAIVPDESTAFSPMGRHIAKVNLEYLDTLKNKPDGKLILVTAITPTPAGEGKTTTSVGLSDGLNKIGKQINNTDMKNISNVIETVLSESNDRSSLQKLREESLYNYKRSGEIIASNLIEIMEKIEK